MHVQQPTKAPMKTIPTHTKHLGRNGTAVSLVMAYSDGCSAAAAYSNFEVVINVAPFPSDLVVHSLEARQVHRCLMLVSIIVFLIGLWQTGSGITYASYIIYCQ